MQGGGGMWPGEGGGKWCRGEGACGRGKGEASGAGGRGHVAGGRGRHVMVVVSSGCVGEGASGGAITGIRLKQRVHIMCSAPPPLLPPCGPCLLAWVPTLAASPPPHHWICHLVQELHGVVTEQQHSRQ